MTAPAAVLSTLITVKLAAASKKNPLTDNGKRPRFYAKH
jgi:hypothetical protein